MQNLRSQVKFWRATNSSANNVSTLAAEQALGKNWQVDKFQPVHLFVD